MPLDKKRVSASLDAWQQAIQQYTLPLWEDLPSLPLYMDQVIMLLNDYLYTDNGVTDGETGITPSMINNYVKMKIVPSPVKKRYSRTHLAYLTMICVFKQTLSIASIPKLLPPDLAEGDIRTLYNDFVRIHREAAQEYAAYVEKTSRPMLTDDSMSAAHVVMRLAASASFSSLLSSQLAVLEEENPQEEA